MMLRHDGDGIGQFEELPGSDILLGNMPARYELRTILKRFPGRHFKRAPFISWIFRGFHQPPVPTRRRKRAEQAVGPEGDRPRNGGHGDEKPEGRKESWHVKRLPQL